MLIRITTKKANSNSVNKYTVLEGTYQDAVDMFRYDLCEILKDRYSSIRTHMVVVEGITDSIVLQAAEQLLESLNKPSKPNPNVTNVDYRGLNCVYNSNTGKHYFGFQCGEITRLVIDPNEKGKKPRVYRSELTKAKAMIRRYCLNWRTICIDDDTIIENKTF